MRRCPALSIAALSISCLSSPALATPSLTMLPSAAAYDYWATLLSPDGTLLVGDLIEWDDVLESGGYGVRWTAASGWAQSPSVGIRETIVEERYWHEGLSANNVLVFNQQHYPNWNGAIAPDAVPPLIHPGLTCLGYVTADAISADGSTVAGTTDCGAYRWTAAGEAPIAPPGVPVQPTSVSDDGQVVAGYVYLAGVPFVWSSGGGYQELPISLSAEGTRISGDGSTLVGTASTANGTEAFVWDAVTGTTFLGDLAGGSFLSRARDVSRDGALVTGTGAAAAGSEAFAWTSTGGLVGLGVPSSAIDMTPAGLVVGTLYGDPDGDDAFVWNPRTG